MLARIVLIGPAYPLRRGGIATYTESLAAAYIRAGREALIYTFRYQYPPWLFPGRTQWSEEPPPEGLPIVARLHSLLPWNWYRTALELAAHAPDALLINAWLPFLAPCLGSVARVVRRRSPQTLLLGIVHNVSPHERFPLARPLMGFLLNGLEGFLALSQAVARELEPFRRRKPYRVHPHPPFDYGPAPERVLARKQLGIPESEPVVLFFGLVRPYKGVDLLAEALALLSNPPLTLIVGEWYMPTDAFEQRLHRLGLAERVRVVNRFIPQQEIPLYFAAADLVVQPYRSATQSGITPLALRYERPVVVTNVGGLPEYVRPGQTGYIVEPRAEALAQAIADFFGNGRAREFAPFLRAAAQEWSWEAVVRTLDLLAEDVLQARSRR